ncbi:MAG: hypothetical protein LBD30_04105 [Verrucomicrobiales bacterium]|jgi:hypothetical protein|nr:hypothetical protein [Verrucomicrobiales bacterium]
MPWLHHAPLPVTRAGFFVIKLQPRAVPHRRGDGLENPQIRRRRLEVAERQAGVEVVPPPFNMARMRCIRSSGGRVLSVSGFTAVFLRGLFKFSHR